MVKIIYALLLGVILAFFVGLGIEAFYPSEKYPETPAELRVNSPEDKVLLTAEQKEAQAKFDERLAKYEADRKEHARYTSLIAIVGSIIFMILSLAILNKKDVFADGFLIGSLLTLIYGIMRGLESDDNKFRFIIVSIGLVVALVLGYFKFPHKEKD